MACIVVLHGSRGFVKLMQQLYTVNQHSATVLFKIPAISLHNQYLLSEKGVLICSDAFQGIEALEF